MAFYSPKKLWLRRVAQLGLSGVLIGLLSLTLLEGYLRYFLPQPAPMLWLTPDARYGHVMKAHFHQRFPFPPSAYVMEVETNGAGFRDRPLPEKDPDLRRVLFMGDSFTFGHGVAVEERFDRICAEILARAGRPIQAVNCGVSAWGSVQATRFVRDHFARLQPDDIVLTFCENDPLDDDYFLTHGISFDRITFPGKTLLRKYCHLFRFAQQQYLLYLKRRATPAQAAAPSENGAKAPAQENVVAPLRLAESIPPENWARSREILRAFAEDFLMYNPEGRFFIQATGPCWEKVRRELAPLAENPHVFFVDLGPVARAVSPERWRLPYDGHWSRLMHRLSAGRLAQVLGAGRPSQ